MALTQITTDGIKDGTITGTDLTTNVDLVDNQKLRLGTGNDLQIYHDGSNSYLIDNGTGDLRLQTQGGHVRINYGTDDMAVFQPSGFVKLYHNNSVKFETTSGGATITGNLLPEADNTRNIGNGSTNFNSIWASTRFRGNDNVKLVLGNSQDFILYHDGTDNLIEAPVGGDLKIMAGTGDNANETCAKFIHNGAVELYYDNSKKFETYSGGVRVNGELLMQNNSLYLNDNAKLRLGTGQDLNIYHDGSNSHVQNGTGTLRIRGDLIKLNNNAASENYLVATANGSVTLCYAGSTKLETTSAGAAVIGSLFLKDASANTEIYYDSTADSLIFKDNKKAAFGDDSDLQIYHDGTNSIIDNSTGVFVVKGDDFRIKSNSTNEDMIRTYVNGAVELYHNNSKKFETNQFGAVVVDTSDETVQLRLDNNSGIAGYLFCLNSNTISLLDSQAHKHVQGIKDGAVELYYDNVKKFETASTGAQVHGSLNVSGDTIVGGELNLMQGTANANRFIDCSLADGQALFIRSTQGGDANHETMASFYRNGEVQLNYDNAHQLSTVSDGIQLQTNKKISRTPNGDGAILAVTNAAYAKSLFIGGWDHGTNSSGISRIRNSNDNLHLDSGSNGGEIFLNAYAAGDIRAKRTRPVSDNLYDLGSSSMRWDDIYATNTNIQTSDKTKKNTIVDSDLGLSFINKLKPVSYKFNDGTRTHYGLIAQDIETVLSDVSKPTTDFAGFIKTDLPDEYYKEAEPNIPEGKKEGDLKSAAHTEYGLRYGEFISPLIKAVQELSAEVETLKTKVAALEAK